MDKLGILLKAMNDMYMDGRIKYGDYLKLYELAVALDGLEQTVEAAESDIAELLWMNGNCEYCLHGKKVKFGHACRWQCSLDGDSVCRPEWRGVQSGTDAQNLAEDAEKIAPAPAPIPAPAPSSTSAKHASRTERMFGAKEAWAARPDAKEENAEEPEEMPEIAERVKTYQGFLLVRCGKCRNTYGFCAKAPISEYRCRDCGGVTPLRGLTALHIRCKCGQKFKYRTNLTEDVISYTCLGCGAPVDVVYNAKKNAYIPL